MRIGKKIIFLITAVFFIIFLINLVLCKSNRGELKGEIVVWTEDSYYSYFMKIANEFEESNRKINIEVISIDEEEYLDKILKTNEKDLPNIVQLNFLEIDKIKDKINFIQENKDIVETYNKNFKDSRLQEVKIDEEYYAVPFESNPIALYVRKDILHKYGYEISDLNTWNDLIRVGNEIKAKTSGELNLFSEMDKNNIDLLMISQLVDYKNNVYTKEDILKEISKIYNDEYVTEDNNYLYRMASLDFYRDMVVGNSMGIWECKNPPSFNVGENKLYDLGGKSLVALNVTKNREAIKEFIVFAATNKELLSKELLDNNFFPSSLYSLNVKEKEAKKENIEGSNPFLILINIVERAPSIKNYDEFKDIVYDLYYN